MGFRSAFQIHPKILAAIDEMGFTVPTEIQKRVIQPILDGKDVMGLAQTGTGKTAAFAIPILHRLIMGKIKVIRVLVIAPTRELAEQIKEEFEMLASKTKFRCCSIYGGVNKRPQLRDLKNRVEIVTACPGRLLDVLSSTDTDLSHIETLVLDEADRMLDMGFMPDIEKIIEYLPAERQNLMFSATMPASVRKFADSILNDPVKVEIKASMPAEAVTHYLYPVSQGQKTDLLVELLRTVKSDSVLVFTRTRSKAKRVAEKLSRDGFDADCIHKDKSQQQRQRALANFKSGKVKILIATDIAARGIDVSTISHVINYDVPEDADMYIHRIGRTGRAAKTGDAFTFSTESDRRLVRDIENVIGKPIERKWVDGFN
ncbi:MAG TPA: DEAD/DEAH box helicase, partial [Sedimentisphaerales bacterium]|nr:DEAD/DEAH box helicase [Sedimentisphaerales bacterium]